MKRQRLLLHGQHESPTSAAAVESRGDQPRFKRMDDGGHSSRGIRRHSVGGDRDGSEAARKGEVREDGAATAMVSSDKGMKHTYHHHHHHNHHSRASSSVKDGRGVSKSHQSYLNGKGSAAAAAAAEESRKDRGREEEGLDSELFESRSRSSIREQETATNGNKGTSRREQQEVADNVKVASESNREQMEKEKEQKESSSKGTDMVAEVEQSNEREEGEMESDGDVNASVAQEQDPDGPEKMVVANETTSEQIGFQDGRDGVTQGMGGTSMQALESAGTDKDALPDQEADSQEHMLKSSNNDRVVEVELDEGNEQAAGDPTACANDKIEAAARDSLCARGGEPECSRVCDDEEMKQGREQGLTLTTAVEDDMTQQARKEARGKLVVEAPDEKELLGENLMRRRLGKERLREGEKEIGKEKVEERQSEKKQRVENGALLSLALPDTSLSLSSGDPHGRQSLPHRHVHSHPSQAPTHTHSTGFTNSISLSHSQPFHHNPSCSLTQTSLDKTELSSGSQQISQAKEQGSHGSWQMSYGSNHANEGFLTAQDRQRSKPLYQRLLQSGNNPQILQGSLGSERLRNQGRDRISESVDISQGSHQVAPADSGLQATHSSDARRSLRRDLQHKHRHNDEVWSSPSQSASSRETQPRDLPTNIERAPSREKGVLEREVAGSEKPFTSIRVQDIVSEPIPSMARKLQELPDSFLEGLKESLRDMLNSIEKREEFVLLQQTLAARTDLVTNTLLRAHRVQLELLVAVKTGILAFLHPDIPMTHSALVEIFLQTKCRNFACQSPLPADECDCKLCAQKAGFCNSCMCVVCSKFDFDANTCRWIGCDFCLHWCHTDCGIRMGYIAPGPSISGAAGTSEMQFHCIACEHTSELYGFVKDVFCAFAPQWKRDVLASELDCVRRIFRDSNDARGQQLCSKAEEMLLLLDAQLDPAPACSAMLNFFSGKLFIFYFPDSVTSTSYSAEPL